MLRQIVRVAVRISAGVVLGAVPGALYAALVGVVHVGVSRRWDGLPAFTVGCVLVGGLLGLVGGTTWALRARPPRAAALVSLQGSRKGVNDAAD
jgi:ABC-type xylose transport system permease subunit